MKPKLVVAIVILVIALVFALENSQTVYIHLLFAEVRSSVAVMVALVFGLGITVPTGALFDQMYISVA